MSILIVIVRSLLDHAASDVIGRATISDRFKEVGNGLVAVRRNRNALARADEAHDRKRAYIGLAGSRRPLDGESRLIHGGNCCAGLRGQIAFGINNAIRPRAIAECWSRANEQSFEDRTSKSLN